jgi:hypothetical protein
VKKHSIAIAEVVYLVSNGKKRRPIFVLDTPDELIRFFSVTSKYTSKSDRIKKLYFEILDWQVAGLRKPSWIDTVSAYTIEKSKVTVSFIGYLSAKDEERFAKFLQENSKNKVL